MKRILFILIVLFVLCQLAAHTVQNLQSHPANSTPSRYEVVAWEENFESGAPGWTHYDGAVMPNNWHIYSYGGTQGNVWWMGDPALASGSNIGGYHNTQYLVLDTPARTLSSANATLTFKLRYQVEDPAGASAPYTGWDAINIRISTNGGASWTPISGTPAYNMTSSYAFGFEHGEGANIPGWGGALTTWTNATFNLSAYVGQSVKIRFAFASDPAYATADQPNMFGVMVDDIAFGGYSNSGVNDGQMTWNSLVPMSGDLWHIASVTGAPSPSQVMRNQNAQGSYNPNMLNYLVSPSITLPATGAIRADFQIQGSFSDNDTFPEVDYWGWEISPDNGSTWYYMSNPYGQTGLPNYVYNDVPAAWASAIASYTLDGIITNYAGMTVKFRWLFKSDADTPMGTGIMIDDFKIFNDIVLNAPTNLSAAVNGTAVFLSWASAGTGVTAYRIYRDDALLTQVASSILSFNDSGVPGGIHRYHVTAVYGANESLPSNVATALVMGNGWIELSNDDGSAETGMNAGTTNQMAVFFDHASPVVLKYMKVYVQAPNTLAMILRGFDNDGENGMPGTQIFQYSYPSANIVQGWNYIEIPIDDLEFDGSFYLGILEATNASQIGLDTSSSGACWLKAGGIWSPYTNGRIMIRGIGVATSTGTTQNIALTSGWNLISLNVSPADHSLATLLTGISASVQQVKGTEGVYIPGNPYSTLSALTDGKAYNIQVSAPVTWSVNGTQIPANTPLALNAGWNMTAYLPQAAMPVTTAMQSVSTWLQQVKGTDGVYIPENPYSTLTSMNPGKGYWIRLSAAHNLIYPTGRYAVEPVQATIHSGITTLTSSMVLLARCDGARAGDILIARVNGELRGAETLITPEGFPAALLQIYTAASGEEVSLWLQKPDGSEVELANRFSSEPNSTLGSYPQFISLHLKNGDPGVAVLATRLYGCYPNPFNPSTTISFSIAEESALVSVNIYNLKGQKVRQLAHTEYPRGEHQLVFGGTDDQGRALSSGIYLIELQTGNYRKTIKALMSK
ncbi:MAG TPA: FlgD immunoglobulin-like domain containing protein [Candidatus Cloacimonadota bacterium]|nr:FlgD immunoglobulin-like domain containing protein [Candidatus Cloacimonadota bacterium]